MGAKELADKYVDRSGEPVKAADEGLRAWSLMTRTHKGVVSILRDLTLYECREAYQRLDPDYGQVIRSYEGRSSSGGFTMGGSYSDRIEQREVFGPPGWEADVEMRLWLHWPRYEFIKFDDPRHPDFGKEKASTKSTETSGITIMPGETISLSVPIGGGISAAGVSRVGSAEVRLVPVAPPTKAPSHPKAIELGLLDCLTVRNATSSHKCGRCAGDVIEGSPSVWVPDGVSLAHSREAIIEQCRLTAYNGHSTSWCVKCAKKLGAKDRPRSTSSAMSAAQSDNLGLWIVGSTAIGILIVALVSLGIPIKS